MTTGKAALLVILGLITVPIGAQAQTMDTAQRAERGAASIAKALAVRRGPVGERSADSRDGDRFADDGRVVRARLAAVPVVSSKSLKRRTAARDSECRKRLYPEERWMAEKRNHTTRCDYRPYR